jgi:hypothetical protein
VAAAFLVALAGSTPLLPGAEQVTSVDLDDTVVETHGYAKQGAGYGYTKVKGLNALLATISTPIAAPVIAAARRGGAAEVAQTSFTAFTSRRTTDHITARLIVRRLKRLNPASVPAGPGQFFTTWRHHAVFTDSPQPMLAAEATHRQHTVIEQVHADLKAGPLAHLPSGSFAANSAWLVLAAIAYNLTRAAGALASAFHVKATTATIRAQLLAVPARPGPLRRRLRLHLPPRLAQGTSLDPTVRRHARSTGNYLTDHRPSRARPETSSGRAGTTGYSRTRRTTNQDQSSARPNRPRATVDRTSTVTADPGRDLVLTEPGR